VTAPGGSWRCHVCGTVYAWWVASCRERHTAAVATGANRGSFPPQPDHDWTGVIDDEDEGCKHHWHGPYEGRMTCCECDSWAVGLAAANRRYGAVEEER
jgi:hypothetical protein